jgi:hypothetical protein
LEHETTIWYLLGQKITVLLGCSLYALNRQTLVNRAGEMCFVAGRLINHYASPQGNEEGTMNSWHDNRPLHSACCASSLSLVRRDFPILVVLLR